MDYDSTTIPAGYDCARNHTPEVLDLWMNTIASCIGRASRFFLVAGLLYWGGEKFEHTLRRYIDALGWGFVVLLVIGLLIWQGG